MPRYKDSPEVRAAKQERREKLRELLALMEVEDVRDLKSVFKEMVGEVPENGLEAELDDKLGYTKYDYRNKDTDNSRNGHNGIVRTSTLRLMFRRLPLSFGSFRYHAERRFAVNHMTQYLRRANPKSDRTAAARPD